IAAEHEDHTEFANCVKEAEDDSRQKRTARERNEDARNQSHWTRAKKARRIDERRIDRGESGNERLQGEWKAVDDRANDKSGKRKCKRVAKHCSNAAADCGARTEQNEKKESQDGWRQNHGQRGERFKGGEPAVASQYENGGKRYSDGEQYDRGHRCETEGE